MGRISGDKGNLIKETLTTLFLEEFRFESLVTGNFHDHLKKQLCVR